MQIFSNQIHSIMGFWGFGVRGKGTSRFIRNDYGKVPELKVSKIIKKY